jgi:glycosyltransferase involved in cell wall biosynthesis
MVSVIIPTFNRSTLVLKAIESALQQTYRDFEIIVIDDGSTDDTAERLAPYSDRIRYFYQENRGPSAAQNKGIEVARGKWISILASDDLWLPTKLERQFRALAELGEEFGACFTDCSYTGDPTLTLSAFETVGLECPAEFGPLADPVKYIIARHPILYVQSMLVLRSVLEKLGRFDEQIALGEDTDLLFRLSFHIRFCVVPAPLVTIDRTPFRQIGMIELFARERDVAYGCIEYRIMKWLRLPELTDESTRQQIQSQLRRIYYSWAIGKLYQFKFVEALLKLRRVRETGHSFPKILATLFFRAARRMVSTIAGGRKVRLENGMAPLPDGLRLQLDRFKQSSSNRDSISS